MSFLVFKRDENDINSSDRVAMFFFASLMNKALPVAKNPVPPVKAPAVAKKPAPVMEKTTPVTRIAVPRIIIASR
ncbi:hypothetical protein [Legionella parisiensis]|uniref:hypothetical protein n=2 Tax=Legionella parisiensis TaxID=45071 RepID=UPI001582F211|nr:hypothetical protein [Legionella parisiensis]